ncbi:MAG: hypothetical protein M1602_05185 [Firmicutes bacterium]|nr:hypothetical protein [Bacillota bacterium]
MARKRALAAHPAFFLALALVSFSLFAVLTRLGMGGTGGREGGLAVPEQFAGLPRTSLLTGEAARREITGMHGRSLAFSDGYKAQYGQGAEQVVVWLVTTADQVKAQALVKEMTDRIGPSNKVFSPPEALQVGGALAYRTEGMGMVHYYYARGNRVYWVGIKSPRERELLARAMAGGL